MVGAVKGARPRRDGGWLRRSQQSGRHFLWVQHRGATSRSYMYWRYASKSVSSSGTRPSCQVRGSWVPMLLVCVSGHRRGAHAGRLNAGVTTVPLERDSGAVIAMRRSLADRGRRRRSQQQSRRCCSPPSVGLPCPLKKGLPRSPRPWRCCATAEAALAFPRSTS